MRGQDASTTGVAAKYNLGWDAVRRFDKEQLEALFKDVSIRDLRIIAAACDMNAAYHTVDKKFLPKAEIVFDQFHVIQRQSADVLKEARQVQSKEVEEEFGKKSDEAKKARKILRTAAWDLVMPEHAITPAIRERLEEIRRANNLMSTMLPLADMVRCIWHS